MVSRRNPSQHVSLDVAHGDVVGAELVDALLAQEEHERHLLQRGPRPLSRVFLFLPKEYFLHTLSAFKTLSADAVWTNRLRLSHMIMLILQTRADIS